MTGTATIPVVDLADWHAGGERQLAFIKTVGESLQEIGFIAVEQHRIEAEVLDRAYKLAYEFFNQPDDVRLKYKPEVANGQRGFTSFGTEHAKGNANPDLKEFWQVGRPDVPDDHAVHAKYGPNVWPDDEVPGFRDTFTKLYQQMDRLGAILLECAARHIGENPTLFADMSRESDTIIRVIHYPPVPDNVPEGQVRAAAHEDINLITLLPGATADGLELLQRDNVWMPVRAGHNTIVADSGDMLQNVTNGLYRATTHRVVNPEGEARKKPRLSMPCFIHPRKDVDLTPLPSCVKLTGGEATYQSITAGDYLAQRLREIGLTK